jgi:hypothetical protein
MYNVLDPIAKQNLAVGATSVASAAFNAATKEVMLTASTACWARIDSTSVAAVAAAAGTIYLPANTPIRFTAKAGHVLNVIQAAAGGYLSIIEGL